MQFSTPQKEEEGEVSKTAQFKEDYKQSLLVDEEILMSRSYALQEDGGFQEVTGELLEFEDQDDTDTEGEEDFDADGLPSRAERWEWIRREIIMRHGLNGVVRFYEALDWEMKEAFDELVNQFGGWAAMLIQYVGYSERSVLSVMEE